MKARVLEELRQHFRPEFLNRVDEIIVFHALGDAELAASSTSRWPTWPPRLAEQDLVLELSRAARRLVATEGYDPAFGARPLKRAIQRLVENPLARALLEGRFPPGSTIVGDADPSSGTLLFSAGDEVVVSEASVRRDARAARPAEPRDALDAAIEEATAPAGKKRDGERLN